MLFQKETGNLHDRHDVDAADENSNLLFMSKTNFAEEMMVREIKWSRGFD